jgi:hypothetical protein
VSAVTAAGQDAPAQGGADAGPAGPGSPTGSGTPSGEVIRLSGGRRGLLVVLLLAVAGLFLAGTAVGQDDWWPFGPWRMYATSTAPSGSIYSTRIDVRTVADPAWTPAPLNPDVVGLNRAEVEGRIPQLTADPAMLGTLARSHARLRAHEAAWTGVRVVRSQIVLSHGRQTGQVIDTTLAQWVAP